MGPGSFDRFLDPCTSHSILHASNIPLSGELGFDRAGWTAAARDYARSVGAGGGDVPEGNWTVAGFRLVTLEELDADLARWT
jgi:hypothetical protein